MFTVKHITDNAETIHEVESTSLDKNSDSSLSGSAGIGMLNLHMQNGVTGSIVAGRAYVMNRYGATVASYDFGEVPDYKKAPLAT